ncbi:acyl-CoA thioesterase II [Sphingomonas sp. Leaf339]|uniref:acyl-CoA thioesterase n=1 Tax=Sphingomonas sp. Leaf339 TaxID=1736343 RepID=UPI0006F4EFB5|nr:acyl-CoA thioesterase II [Sphingomonas sp. Leaf339]KQU56079.1 acyl-CoA thioesterase II [Sphingomonas sp. Leaf339]
MNQNMPVDVDPTALVAGLVTLLDVEQIDVDLFRGARQPGGEGRVFGGQVIAQALQAAQRSTDAPKVANSLHAYFMRPGDENHPIVFRVVRDFEGRSFATRRVIAMQRGKPILNMACSFQVPEEGFTHQDTMPDVPSPDTLTSEAALRRDMADRIPPEYHRVLLRPRPIDIRPVCPRSWIDPAPGDPVQAMWFRLVAPIGDDAALHRAVLAYASDMGLLGTGMIPHGVGWMNPRMQVASLDHALWLHEPFRADEWLLYAMRSPWAGHARGFNRGSVFTQDGRLVASVAQEGLIRQRD